MNMVDLCPLFKKPVELGREYGKRVFGGYFRREEKCSGSPFATFTSAGCRE